VLCEKPLANTVPGARALCELAEARDLLLAVGYIKRFEPNFELMKRLIDGRFLGALHRFELEYGTNGGWAPVSAYNLQREHAGGGVLMVNGCHLLDRMLCWFGAPSSVAYSDDAHGGVEANCSARFGFPSGIEGELTLSKTRSLRNRFRLEGDRGAIEIRDTQLDSVTFFPSDGPECRHEIFDRDTCRPATDVQLYTAQIDDFARAIQARTTPRVSGRQGLASIELIERCYRVRTPLAESCALDAVPALLPPPRRASPGVRGRVLVTGASGFVGSRLCEVLHLSAGHQPRAFVHSSGKAAYIARYPLDLKSGDLMDRSSIRSAIDGCSTVVHLARGSNAVMIKGLEHLLHAAVEAGIARFVHVSSVAVYGDNPPAEAASETAPARRTGNPYGDIKLEQEELVARYGARFGLPYVILRPPHILGPYSHFATALADRLRAGALAVVDEGGNICNLVYVDNLIQAILLALDEPAAVGETFFVTDRERVTWRKCLDDFGELFGVRVPRIAADRLAPPERASARESVLKLLRIVASDEARSAALGIPPLAATARLLSRAYAAVPEKHRRYVRYRLGGGTLQRPTSSAAPRIDGSDYLIASQRRQVVHACEKAERVLGYTAPVGYDQAMAITKAWLQFAGMIDEAPVAYA